jgi:hypothetical protein
MFYVVKPLYVDADEPKIFRTPEAVNKYVNTGQHGADVCQYAKIEAVNARSCCKIQRGAM